MNYVNYVIGECDDCVKLCTWICLLGDASTLEIILLM